MGNCQAVDAAALVIQHPSGKIERMYWSISASEVMKMNPGHYVSIIIPLPPTDGEEDGKTVRFTREVMKVVRAKRHAKTKTNNLQAEPTETSSSGADQETLVDNTNQVEGHERMFRQRSGSSSSIMAASRSKSWRPALQSISEATS
uniref:uncharacterized protein LOC122600806 isoform X2 n=1 Tax=Erigeron canadensis TaxID=72917 RepID=UPI001CB89FF2|nr:uncharacterized protein LOC122600806 isoform X2 [Erigeron canadensis]